MLTGLSKAGPILAGLAGIVMLNAATNAVALVAEAARRVCAQILVSVEVMSEKSWKEEPPSTLKDIFRLSFPFSNIPTWSKLSTVALCNVVAGAGALFLLNKCAPSLVVNANNILHYIAPIQFTSKNFVLLSLFNR